MHLVNYDSVPIFNTTTLSLLAQPVPGRLVSITAFEAKPQQSGSLRTLVWDSDLTEVPLIYVNTTQLTFS